MVYLSDHGSHFRTRNSEYKRACHDGDIHVPLLICGPGFEGGRVVPDMVSLLDIPPTLLACGGIPTPADFQGRPLQQLVDGTAVGWPEHVFVRLSEAQVGRAVRTKKWKYSVRDYSKNGWRESEERPLRGGFPVRSGGRPVGAK